MNILKNIFSFIIRLIVLTLLVVAFVPIGLAVVISLTLIPFELPANEEVDEDD